MKNEYRLTTEDGFKIIVECEDLLGINDKAYCPINASMIVFDSPVKNIEKKREPIKIEKDKRNFDTWEDFVKYISQHVVNDNGILKYCPIHITTRVKNAGYVPWQIAFEEYFGWFIIWDEDMKTGVVETDKGYMFLAKHIGDGTVPKKIEKQMSSFELENEHLLDGFKNLKYKFDEMEFLFDNLLRSENNKTVVEKERVEGLKQYFKQILNKISNTSNHLSNETDYEYTESNGYFIRVPYMIAKRCFENNVEITNAGKDFILMRDDQYLYFANRTEDGIFIKVSFNDGDTLCKGII